MLTLIVLWLILNGKPTAMAHWEIVRGEAVTQTNRIDVERKCAMALLELRGYGYTGYCVQSISL